MASLLCSAVAAAVLAAADLRPLAKPSGKPFFRLLTAAAHTKRSEWLYACTCQARKCLAENVACSLPAACAPVSIILPIMYA